MSDFMGIATIRRIASDLLGVGENRVKIKPEEIKKVEEALTRDDVRSLIKEGVIYAERKKGVSRIKAKIKIEKKKAGRSRGTGSRKGKKYSRIMKKLAWMRRVKAQRALLKKLRLENKLKEGAYRTAYMMIKGGAFRSKGSMLSHLKDSGLLREK